MVGRNIRKDGKYGIRSMLKDGRYGIRSILKGGSYGIRSIFKDGRYGIRSILTSFSFSRSEKIHYTQLHYIMTCQFWFRAALIWLAMEFCLYLFRPVWFVSCCCSCRPEECRVSLYGAAYARCKPASLYRHYPSIIIWKPVWKWVRFCNCMDRA